LFNRKASTAAPTKRSLKQDGSSVKRVKYFEQKQTHFSIDAGGQYSINNTTASRQTGVDRKTNVFKAEGASSRAKSPGGLEKEIALTDPGLFQRQKEMEGSDGLYHKNYEQFEVQTIEFKTLPL